MSLVSPMVAIVLALSVLALEGKLTLFSANILCLLKVAEIREGSCIENGKTKLSSLALCHQGSYCSCVHGDGNTPIICFV